MDETKDLDWADRWPIIDENGVIEDIVDSDEILDSDKFVEWINGAAIETDGSCGFDAIIR